MRKTSKSQRKWLTWVLLAGGWTLFGLFFASESILNRAYVGRPLQLGETVAAWLICAYLWLALTPLIVWLARSFPLERRGWRKNLFVHLLFGSGIALLQLSLFVLVGSFVGLEIGESPFIGAFRNQFIWSFHSEILTYGAVVGLIHALDYYRKYREREIRASQLEAQLARAQLDALRMQLQPHFLFNTLNTISVLMKEDVALADRLLLRLSELLRLALRNTDTHEVSLREEVDFLHSYLEIEQTRFQDRLTVRIEIDPNALDAQVPNLILQPLVENAIRHAVAPLASKSTLEILASRHDGQVELQVRDNGPGITDKTSAMATKGIGLRNTRARLEKLYGPAHSFELSPANGGGLEVTIIIPFHTGNGDAGSSHGENPHPSR